MPENGRDNGAVERLLADTRSPDTLTRLRAAEALGTTGNSRAAEPLIALLDDPFSCVVLAALTSLGTLGDPAAVAPITDMLYDHRHAGSMGREFAISQAAANTLAQLGEPGFQALMRILRDHIHDEFLGMRAVGALGRLHDPRSIEVLFLALHSPTYEVSRAAVGALVRFGDLVVPQLVAALQSPNGNAAFHARRALRDFEAVALPLLLDLYRTTDEGYVRADVIEALAHMDDPRALEVVRQALDDPDEDVRQAAVEALGRRGEASVVDQLLDFPRPEPNQGLDTVVDILVAFGPPIIVPLLRALQNPARTSEARARAAETLGKVGNKDTIWPLIMALRDEDEQVRRAAAGALGELKDARAVEPLLETLGTDTPAVRRAAVQALGHFDDARAIDALIQVARTAGADSDARRLAIFALAMNQQERALPVLRELALAGRDPREDRDAYRGAGLALTMLGHLGQPAVPALIEVIKSKGSWWPDAALRHLYRPGKPLDPEVAEQLVAMLHDSRPLVRHRVAIVLGESGDARAIEPLIEEVRQPSPIGRLEAAQALGKIGDERALSALEQALAEGMNTGGRHNLHPSVEVELRDTIQDAILGIRMRQREPAQVSEPTPTESEHQTHD